MEDIDSLKTLLEILVLVLTLSTQNPLLGIVAAVGAIYFLLTDAQDDDNADTN